MFFGENDDSSVNGKWNINEFLVGNKSRGRSNSRNYSSGTNKENYDKVSARGYAFGYVGSVILLLISFAIIEMHAALGFEEKSAAVRVSFVLVGLWWFSFAQYSFRHLPKQGGSTQLSVSGFISGFKEIVKVQRAVVKMKVSCVVYPA